MTVTAARSTRRHHFRLSALLLVLLLFATACGPRFDRDALTISGGASAPEADAGGFDDGSSQLDQGFDDGSVQVDDSTFGGEVAVGDEGLDGSGGDTTDASADGSAGSPDPGTSDSGASGSASGDATSGETSGGTSGETSGGTSGGTTGATAPPAASAGPGPTPGVTDTEIVIGYLLPLTGAAPLPAGFDDGVNVYWNYLNANGGVNGRSVRIIIYDTQSTTSDAVAQARKAVTEDKVFTILSLDRLEVQDAIAKFLEQVGMPHIMVQAPASPPSTWKNTFVASVDHIVQGRGIATFFADDLKAKDGATKVGFVREQTNALKPGTDAFEQRGAELGLDVVAKLTTQPSNNDQSGTVSALQNSGAEIVWLYMAPTVAANIIGSAGARGYTPIWFANNISWQFELANDVTAGYLDGAYAFSSFIPLNDKRADAYKAEYRRQIADPTKNPDDIGLVGWGAGEVLSDVLDSAGKNLGWDSLRSALKKFKKPGNVWTALDFTGGFNGANVVKVLKSNGQDWSLFQDDRVLR
ncbi:MAG: branched-chain amino acid transport system substrate-binding protein [Glaciecola sp.]|jgi:branched-chain amino acid transport system substrate-binding protein